MIVQSMPFPAGGGPALTPPTFVNYGTHTPGSLTAGYPASPVAGRMLEAVINFTGGGADTDYSLAGWIAGPKVFWVDSLSAAWGGFVLLYKEALGTESGSATFVRSGTVPNRDGAIISQWDGVDLSASPYEGQTSNIVQNTGSDTSYESPPITTGGSGRHLVNLFRQNISQAIDPITAGWSEAWDVERIGVGPDYRMTMHHKDAVGTGAQALEEASTATSTSVACLAYALKGL